MPHHFCEKKNWFQTIAANILSYEMKILTLHRKTTIYDYKKIGVVPV